MKLFLIALATAASAVAHAQPIHRCEDSQANVSYQQTACASVARVVPVSLALSASAEAASPTDAEIGQPSARRMRAKQEAVDIAARVLLRQQQPDLRRAQQYAENRQRCAEAMRVAELCGKHAGTFYCDEQGFQPIPEAARAKTVALDNSGTYRMERCALDATKPGS